MVERRTEQEISVKEPHSRRLQAKDRSDPAFLDNRSLIPAETALSSLLDHMHVTRSEEHTYELQSLMSISYAVFGLKKKDCANTHHIHHNITRVHLAQDAFHDTLHDNSTTLPILTCIVNVHNTNAYFATHLL